jgi:hypothetical protein
MSPGGEGMAGPQLSATRYRQTFLWPVISRTATYPMGTGGHFRKLQGREGDHSPQISAEVPRSRIRGSIHPLPYTPSWLVLS